MRARTFIILIVFLSVVVFFKTWFILKDNQRIECRARIHTVNNDTKCPWSSSADILLSLDQGNGYFSISGSHSCPESGLSEKNGLIHFTYTQKGSYYTIHPTLKDRELSKIYPLLAHEDMVIKVLPVNNDDYIVTTPFSALMMCKDG